MIEEIQAKTLVQKVKYDNNKWFGIDYNINLYKGCSHGCIYCDSRSNCYQIEDFDRVRVKENTSEILRRELKSKKMKGVIGIGAMSDTYNPYEAKLKVTRRALELIDEFGFGISIDTKSALVTRDIDIIQRIVNRHSGIVKLTITTADDLLSKIIEPNVNASSKRFETIKELSREGIFCGVLLAPLLPFITDTEENIKEIVRLAYENGAKFVYGMYGVTLRENQREYFYEQLNNKFEGLTSKYREQYKDAYFCNSLKSRHLQKILEDECKQYGLFYKMEDIIENYKKKRDYQQISLF
ncbi:SPL family radical SAM protein [Anaerosacchariphilus polymeriproducens]|uniref:Radical SAM protein n=1 Tax=Anaerosacchariphilus polymeriproducens TaxID=1812858 RepID=A0A371AUT7_9FIRM|nr:radical SAM protein [Anaerosacchariphilus polymeriproducens]RDU23336.1 radical SAM protein [Anaerosacchariphilus polymeriproducens]